MRSKLQADELTRRQLSELSGCSLQQLQSWDETGVLTPKFESLVGRARPQRVYSAKQSIAVLNASQLRGRMSTKAILRFIKSLKRSSPPLLVTDGDSVWEASSGNDAVLIIVRSTKPCWIVDQSKSTLKLSAYLASRL